MGRFAAGQGHEVFGVARSSQGPAAWPGEFATADVARSDLAGSLAHFQPDVVLHAAGSASVGASFSNPPDDFRANVETLTNVLDGVRRGWPGCAVIILSSAAVYGNPERLPVNEEQPLRPLSPYGFHKQAAEVVATGHVACFGTRVCICRLFSVFGTAQRRLLVWELVQQLIGPKPTVVLSGTGRESRDYLHIADVASGILALGEKLSRSEPTAYPWIVNLGSGVEMSIAKLASAVQASGKWSKPIEFGGNLREGDPENWCADISRLTSLAPYWRQHAFEERLRGTIAEWVKEAV